ncbi:hypothetical protein KNCP2_08390 [Candidatus Rickettsia kedanie]|uniref:Alpha/beta hydrolase n=1 Tax=Candidatus Rickettsia kedanie TaxID=3115352 RepID=A0ABP9TV79_9RICK
MHGMKSQILTKSTVKKMKETKIFDLYEIKYAGHAPSLMNSEEINYIKFWLEQKS